MTRTSSFTSDPLAANDPSRSPNDASTRPSGIEDRVQSSAAGIGFDGPADDDLSGRGFGAAEDLGPIDEVGAYDASTADPSYGDTESSRFADAARTQANLEQTIANLQDQLKGLDTRVRRVVIAQPVLAVAGAVAAGFVLGRILRR